MKPHRYILLFALFFGLHYLEGFGNIGPLSIAQIWKMPILLLLLIGSLASYNNWTKIEKRGYLMVAALFFCPAITTNPISIIVYAAKELPFFLLLRYWFKIGAKNPNILWTILITLAQYVCLASLLTLTIVEPVKVQDKSFWYGDGEMAFYSSIFGNPHPAGSYFCISIIVLLMGFKNSLFKTSWSKIYNIVLLVIAWYSLYLTFVRTVWLMTLLAVIFIYIDFRKINMKKILTAISVLVVLSVGVIYLYNNNEAFRVRVSGRSDQIIDTEGSGREHFWITAVEQWSKNDVYGLLFGKGFDKVREDNLIYNGLEVFSHNQFIDALAQYGLIGLVLLIGYYYAIFKFIKSYKRQSKLYLMSLSMFVSTMVFAFFQNEMYFIYAVMFSLAIAIMYYNNSLAELK